MGYGSEIKQKRRIKGLTQAELALKINVSRSAVYAWERGMYPPTNAKKLAALENALDLEPGYLYLLIFQDSEGCDMTFDSIKGGAEMDECALTTQQRVELKDTLLSFVKRVGGAEPGYCSTEEIAILPDMIEILLNSF